MKIDAPPKKTWAAHGPWVLVKPEPFPNKSAGGLYVPAGNLSERLGHVVAKVLSVGKGHFKDVKVDGRDTQKFYPAEIKPGDRVVFRGHLKNANRIDFDPMGKCFMHQADLIGVLEDGASLDLCVPYNN